MAAGLVVLVGGAWAWWQGAVGTVPLRPHCTATANGQVTELDPEQAGNAAIIAAVAVRRQLPPRAASIAIATAMQESKLRNLGYGDRDSLGLFQQRPSQGWGTPTQILDPVYASDAFYDVLVKIEGYQNLPITTAAQKVQRSAFPQAYAAHEPEARAFASALTGYSPAALNCVLDAPSNTGGTAATTSTTGSGASGTTTRAGRVQALVNAARHELGQAGRATGDGSTVRFTFRDADVTRSSWSLAQWAVARADGLSIVSVQVAGQQWRRDHPGSTWTAGGGAPAGSGSVLVQVS